MTETAYLHRAAPRANCRAGTIHPKAQVVPVLSEDKRAAGPLYTCRCGALVFERDRASHVLEEHPEMFTRVADAAPRGAP
jgi:hypothetical protein